MRNPGLPLLWSLLIVLGGASAGAAVTVRDDAGREVRLQKPARRIVSLAPHATELLFAAGAGEYVVGVSEHSDYPLRAARLPTVGGGSGLDLEAIIALRPDLVVAWQSGNSPGQLSQLERLGVTLFYSEPRRVEVIATSLERLGALAGSADVARSAAAEFREGVARLAARYAGRDEVTVFYQIWDRPLMTVNGQHLISAWLRLCGARNVFSDMPRLASGVSLEAVLAADPQAIISGSYAGKGRDWSALWRAWPQLDAVRHARLYSVDAQTMERQTPRALSAAQRLCEEVDRARR